VAFEERFDAVLEAARRGDEQAWVELYDELAPVLLGYLTAQRAPHPEDVVSEVLLQVVRDLPTFGGTEANFRSWVFTIAHHRLIDARRHAQRRPAEPTDVITLDRKLPSEEFESEVLEAITTEELTMLLDVLTPDQRNVLFLRVVGGLSLPEVGQVLGKQHESVRALQKRALVTLRKELAAQPYPFHGGVALTKLR
jgi:RNA polymerase sigma factor (sigma-70 family)